MIRSQADALGETHLESEVGENQAAGFELLGEAGKAMGESGDGFAGLVLEGAPIGKVLPEPPGTRRVVQGDQVVPEFDAVIGLEEVMAGATEEFVVNAVTATEGTLVEQAGEILGNGGVGAGGTGVLENVQGIRAPGGATDLGLEDAFPLGEESLVDRELQVVRFGDGVKETPAFARPGVRGATGG
jgi:hypothetical protein